MKKRIICFGDSLTWGYDPDTGTRFDENTRWTGVLANELGSDYVVVEEGQNGRTIATDDPTEGVKNGLDYIEPCIESHKPFDCIIIMLGSNDMKKKFGYCAMDIAGEMQRLLEKICTFNTYRNGGRAKIVLMSPPYIGENIRQSWLASCFDYESTHKVSRELADWYKQLSEMYDCTFIDAAQYVDANDSSDSCHLTGPKQITLGKEVAKVISSIL